MRTMRVVKTCVVGGLLVVGLSLFASSASALSPWWHLTSGARPTNIQPGAGHDEVQELVVSATGGEMFLAEPIAFEKEELVNGKGEEEFAILPYNASALTLQEGLEKFYGEGNIQVTGGPGDETASKPYTITFVGALADKGLAPIVSVTSELLNCEGATGTECKKTATVSEKDQGRADGQIVVYATNVGDAKAQGETSPVSIVDALPAGLRATSIEASAISPTSTGDVSDGPVQCVLASLTCTFSGVLASYDIIEVLISVASEGASSGELNEVSVSGGGAPATSIERPVSLSSTPARFGAEDYTMVPEEEGGAVDTQAGSHMFQLTTTFTLNQKAEGSPVALAKDLHFNLPPGLIGNATAYPQCSLKDFLTPVSGLYDQCSGKTAVGIGIITAFQPGSSGSGLQQFKVPIFNIQPAYGEPARFGFFLLRTPVILDTALRTGGDYGVTVNVDNITQLAGFVHNIVTFWGVPGDPRHNNQRGWGCILAEQGVTPQKGAFEEPCVPSEERPQALLSMPTSCTGAPLQTNVEMDSWEERENVLTAGSTLPMPTMDGCNRLPFHASIIVTPDGQAGSTPTGLTVTEHVPQEVTLNATGLSEAQVKDTTVVLPAGVVLNPAAADGLQSCSETQVALSVDTPAGCPEAAKVGTVEIDTPLLPEPVEGEAYLAAQNQNPFGSLLALYIVAEAPKSGIIVKVAGEVKPDPVTGQLVSTFKSTPQVPFEDLKLHFFGGSRAPLSTPGLCGAYTSTASIAPWSANPPIESASTFNVISGPNGTPCHNPLPFSPSLTAGTTSIQAGGFGPFTMTMSRPDGSQNLQAVRLAMPPGLLGTLATVKLCKEAQANAGTCGPESLIGHTIVSVGVGGNPYTVQGGEVFITEGYGGAPYGLSIVNPAKAGPFDLGKVIVRAKIEVDPITAALTVTTDNTGPYKIPTILDGIPLQIQHVEVSIDRPNFTFNPTDCAPLQIGGNLYSSEGSTTTLKVPFQITNCAVLAFKPHLTAKTNGKTSRANGASLSVKLTYPAGPYDANISKVKVDLPKQLPSRLTTLQKACPAATFNANPAACPSASIVGHAKATTPVLPVSLEGPAYFVSHGGEEFPQLIIVLQGYGTTVHLVGDTFINKAGVTSSTFKQVPDVPVGTFELTLPQGKYSALAANGNLCTIKNLNMPTSFVAQNGVEQHTTTPIVPTGCTKHKATKAKHSKGKHTLKGAGKTKKK